MTWYSSSSRLSSLGIYAAVFGAAVCSARITVEAEAPPLVRVRSNNPSIAAIIQDATDRSTLFRRLIETINATDGLVYVDEGKCRHSVSACLVLSVKMAGPYRLLRILVDPHKYDRDCERMAAIGHELRHAIEVLSEPNVRDYPAVQSFFDRVGPTGGGEGRFETPAAMRTGLDVLAEACAHGTAAATDEPPISRVRSTDTSIATLINRAARGSETFQRLLATIQRSNGIVYIEPGSCGHGARSCLKMSVVANGPDRFLRVLVDRQRADLDVDFMGSLGHELQHAIEALSQPSTTNGAKLYNFFKREAPTDDNRFETKAAINAGDAVRDELRVH
jgi:hypothetical protein